MRMRTLLLPALVLIGAWTLTSPAAAQRGRSIGDSYIGGSYGGSDFRDACSDGLEEQSAGERCDRTDGAWKLFGGYRFDRSWSVELAWVDLGSARDRVPDDGLVIEGELAARGLALAAVGTLPLGDHVGLFAKAGVLNWRSDIDVRGDLVTFSEGSSGDSFFCGAGVAFLFGERVELRAEWERFQEVGDSSLTGGIDIDLLSAGLAVRF